MLFRAPEPSILRDHVIQYSRIFSLNTLFLVVLAVVLLELVKMNTCGSEVIDLTLSNFFEEDLDRLVPPHHHTSPV